MSGSYFRQLFFQLTLVYRTSQKDGGSGKHCTCAWFSSQCHTAKSLHALGLFIFLLASNRIVSRIVLQYLFSERFIFLFQCSFLLTSSSPIHLFVYLYIAFDCLFINNLSPSLYTYIFLVREPLLHRSHWAHANTCIGEITLECRIFQLRCPTH